jgi:hypothetical protein
MRVATNPSTTNMIVPPEVVRHMEYSVRAQERKEELELVRRKSLAKPQSKLCEW